MSEALKSHIFTIRLKWRLTLKCFDIESKIWVTSIKIIWFSQKFHDYFKCPISLTTTVNRSNSSTIVFKRNFQLVVKLRLEFSKNESIQLYYWMNLVINLPKFVVRKINAVVIKQDLFFQLSTCNNNSIKFRLWHSWSYFLDTMCCSFHNNK